MKERGSERIEFLCNYDPAQRALIDLSTSGAAFIHPVEIKKGTKISVRIKDYLIEAVIVYCQQRTDGYRVGMQFIKVLPDIEKALKIMVDEFSRGVPLLCEVVG